MRPDLPAHPPGPASGSISGPGPGPEPAADRAAHRTRSAVTRPEGHRTLARWVAEPRLEDPQRPTRLAHRRTLSGGFTLIYTLALIYGSLFPWIGWRPIGLSGLDFLGHTWPRYWTWFDLLANVALYLPFGLLLTWRLLHRWTPSRALIMSWLVGCILSICMESLQTFMPGRIPSSLDVLSNALGTLLGGLTALLFWRARWIDGTHRLEAHARIMAILLLVWLGLQVLPQRLPFESGLFVQSLMHQLDDRALAPQESIGTLLAGHLRESLEPSRLWLQEMNNYADLLEAGAVSAWVVVIGLMTACTVRRPGMRPIAIGVLLLAGLLVHIASALWLFPHEGGPHFWLTPGAQAGALLGVLVLALIAALPTRQRLPALVAWLALALLFSNIAPDGAYLPAPGAQPPAWRNLIALLTAISVLWPFAVACVALHAWLQRLRTRAAFLRVVRASDAGNPLRASSGAAGGASAGSRPPFRAS